MDDLNQEIRRLAREFQVVEQMLVEVCGVPPVTPRTSEFGQQWASRLRSLYQRACCYVGLLSENGDLLVVRTPQPD